MYVSCSKNKFFDNGFVFKIDTHRSLSHRSFQSIFQKINRKQNFNFMKLLRILFTILCSVLSRVTSQSFFFVNRDLTKIYISRQKLTKNAKRKLVKPFLKFLLPGNTKIYVFITEICIFITQ